EIVSAVLSDSDPGFAAYQTLVNQFDTGAIPDSVKTKFKAAGHELSGLAVLSVKQRQSLWTILDKKKLVEQHETLNLEYQVYELGDQNSQKATLLVAARIETFYASVPKLTIQLMLDYDYDDDI